MERKGVRSEDRSLTDRKEQSNASSVASHFTLETAATRAMDASNDFIIFRLYEPVKQRRKCWYER